jgi:hypothetical protein
MGNSPNNIRAPSIAHVFFYLKKKIMYIRKRPRQCPSGPSPMYVSQLCYQYLCQYLGSHYESVKGLRRFGNLFCRDTYLNFSENCAVSERLHTISKRKTCTLLGRVEMGSNTCPVALRVVRGEEKGTQCLGYNWATLFLGDINMGT